MDYVIWSIEHQSWWGHFSRGYVANVRDAGVYTDDASQAIVDDANKHSATILELRIPRAAVQWWDSE